MKVKNVTVSECKSSGNTWKTRVIPCVGETENQCVDRAIEKIFGKGRWLHKENGIEAGLYGQICEPHKPNGNNCITGRVRIEIS